MNKYLLISLCLFANTAFATWTFVGKNNVGTIFYEYESVKKDGDLITVFVYTDFNIRQSAGEISALYQVTFRCSKPDEVNLTYAKLFKDSGLRDFISEESGNQKLEVNSSSPLKPLINLQCRL
jgi:hypothetical protein